jgi:hypothetical protein
VLGGDGLLKFQLSVNISDNHAVVSVDLLTDIKLQRMIDTFEHQPCFLKCQCVDV